MSSSSQDQFKYTTIAHSDHRYCCPLSPAKASTLIAALQLAPDALVLDAGCGKAALLRDLLQSTPASVRGIGVDINSRFLAEAANEWASSNPGDDRLTLVESLIVQHPLPATGYDAILCIGSSHAFGGFDRSLAISKQWLKPGGLLLIGESYWKLSPSEQYLAMLGATRDELTSHEQNASRALTHGYKLLTSTVSSDDEWDQYEGMYYQAMMRHVATHPEDPDATGFSERAQRWYDSYLASGKAMLGFGYYLLEKS
ncbi:Methyltransferase domain-containing protein [Collimonas sp. OK242]|uniref:class I SAM-dependent methyltransferase n=1 Tax=Collimonas sp. OK242 TaxID=1798195 RepID=UPI00089BE23D|nr:class I SAM-dependent methyltransferase [Collimonas sp. OK242]SDY68792.1 Methyltransferase domain-containing protein [Collimonas sp. OK242]